MPRSLQPQPHLSQRDSSLQECSPDRINSESSSSLQVHGTVLALGAGNNNSQREKFTLAKSVLGTEGLGADDLTFPQCTLLGVLSLQALVWSQGPNAHLCLQLFWGSSILVSPKREPSSYTRTLLHGANQSPGNGNKQGIVFKSTLLIHTSCLKVRVNLSQRLHPLPCWGSHSWKALLPSNFFPNPHKNH